MVPSLVPLAPEVSFAFLPSLVPLRQELPFAVPLRQELPFAVPLGQEFPFPFPPYFLPYAPHPQVLASIEPTVNSFKAKGKRKRELSTEEQPRNRWKAHKKDTCRCAVCKQCRGELSSTWFKHDKTSCKCSVCRQARGEKRTLKNITSGEEEPISSSTSNEVRRLPGKFRLLKPRPSPVLPHQTIGVGKSDNMPSVGASMGPSNLLLTYGCGGSTSVSDFGFPNQNVIKVVGSSTVHKVGDTAFSSESRRLRAQESPGEYTNSPSCLPRIRVKSDRMTFSWKRKSAFPMSQSESLFQSSPQASDDLSFSNSTYFPAPSTTAPSKTSGTSVKDATFCSSFIQSNQQEMDGTKLALSSMAATSATDSGITCQLTQSSSEALNALKFSNWTGLPGPSRTAQCSVKDVTLGSRVIPNNQGDMDGTWLNLSSMAATSSSELGITCQPTQCSSQAVNALSFSNSTGLPAPSKTAENYVNDSTLDCSGVLSDQRGMDGTRLILSSMAATSSSESGIRCQITQSSHDVNALSFSNWTDLPAPSKTAQSCVKDGTSVVLSNKRDMDRTRLTLSSMDATSPSESGITCQLTQSSSRDLDALSFSNSTDLPARSKTAQISVHDKTLGSSVVLSSQPDMDGARLILTSMATTSPSESGVTCELTQDTMDVSRTSKLADHVVLSRDNHSCSSETFQELSTKTVPVSGLQIDWEGTRSDWNGGAKIAENNKALPCLLHVQTPEDTSDNRAVALPLPLTLVPEIARIALQGASTVNMRKRKWTCTDDKIRCECGGCMGSPLSELLCASNTTSPQSISPTLKRRRIFSLSRNRIRPLRETLHGVGLVSCEHILDSQSDELIMKVRGQYRLGSCSSPTTSNRKDDISQLQTVSCSRQMILASPHAPGVFAASSLKFSLDQAGQKPGRIVQGVVRDVHRDVLSIIRQAGRIFLENVKVSGWGDRSAFDSDDQRFEFLSDKIRASSVYIVNFRSPEGSLGFIRLRIYSQDTSNGRPISAVWELALTVPRYSLKPIWTIKAYCLSSFCSARRGGSLISSSPKAAEVNTECVGSTRVISTEVFRPLRVHCFTSMAPHCVTMEQGTGNREQADPAFDGAAQHLAEQRKISRGEIQLSAVSHAICRWTPQMLGNRSPSAIFGSSKRGVLKLSVPKSLRELVTTCQGNLPRDGGNTIFMEAEKPEDDLSRQSEHAKKDNTYTGSIFSERSDATECTDPPCETREEPRISDRVGQTAQFQQSRKEGTGGRSCRDRRPALSFNVSFQELLNSVSQSFSVSSMRTSSSVELLSIPTRFTVGKFGGCFLPEAQESRSATEREIPACDSGEESKTRDLSYSQLLNYGLNDKVPRMEDVIDSTHEDRYLTGDISSLPDVFSVDCMSPQPKGKEDILPQYFLGCGEYNSTEKQCTAHIVLDFEERNVAIVSSSFGVQEPVSRNETLSTENISSDEAIGSFLELTTPLSLNLSYTKDKLLALDNCCTGTENLAGTKCSISEQLDLYGFEILPTNMFREQQKTEFRQKLMMVLNKPFDMLELEELEKSVAVRKPQMRLRESRHASGHVPLAKEGLSYLEHYPDFRRKLESTNVAEDKLKLLRGFFFWIQHSCMSGAFTPWEEDGIDNDCQIIEESCGAKSSDRSNQTKKVKGRDGVGSAKKRSRESGSRSDMHMSLRVRKKIVYTEKRKIAKRLATTEVKIEYNNRTHSILEERSGAYLVTAKRRNGLSKEKKAN